MHDKNKSSYFEYPPELDALDEAATTDRAAEVVENLKKTPSFNREEMESLATKMNLAVVTGNHTLTAAEAIALKTISQKFIKDSPKEVTIQAQIKTEQVILGYLEEGPALRNKLDQSSTIALAEQSQKTQSLEGFRDQFLINEAIKE